jgi:glycerophosphoryl diester phosphodiesterase
VIVQSFDVRTLKEIKKLAPAIRTAQLTYEELLDIVPALKFAKTDIWSPNYKWITPEAVKEAQAAGIKVAPWTINTAKEWDLAIAAGVDAIITDYPAALVEHLEAGKAAKKSR